MQKCLHEQIGRNVHAYVDDVVIKTKEKKTLLDDLKETFTNLRRFQMKLNPEKCTFGVPAGQLLDYLVSARGKPDQDRGYRTDGTAHEPERYPEVRQLHGFGQPFPEPARRKSITLVCPLEKDWHVRLE
jgi:hypothetical protein